MPENASYRQALRTERMQRSSDARIKLERALQEGRDIDLETAREVMKGVERRQFTLSESVHQALMTKLQSAAKPENSLD